MAFEIDEQWKDIMEDNIFSRRCSVITTNADEFEVFGVYYSGSYTQRSQAPYSERHWEREDYFQFSSLSLPKCIKREDLRNAQFEIEGKGLFTVIEVKGEESGMITCFVRTKESEYV